MRYIFFLAFISFILPGFAQASISISEIVWMGSAESANHEWIELHNDSASIDVTGWRLSDGNNFDVVLDGIVAGDAYVVLERTSDDSAPGSAWQIYTGALVNTGTTLSLYDENGSRVDQVVGGENWQNIGGDNETKDTAQWSGATWITAPASPDSAPTTVTPTPTDNETATPVKTKSQSSALAVTKSNSSKSTPLIISDSQLQLNITGPTQGYVNQPVTLQVRASGLGDTLKNSLQYDWNFGDGYTVKSEETVHQFTHPGTYVVTVFGSYKRHEAVARQEITILPQSLSLARTNTNQLLLHNDSPYEIDISGYTVRTADESFTFAPYSYVLERQSVAIPNISKANAVVYDNVSMLVAAEQRATLAQQQNSESIVTASAPAAQLVSSTHTPTVVTEVMSQELSTNVVPDAESRFGFVEKDIPRDIVLSTSTSASNTNTVFAIDAEPFATSTQVATVRTAVSEENNFKDWWLGGLIALLVISVFAIYSKPTRP